MLVLQLLGSPQAIFKEESVDIRSAKANALLFYLALNQHPHSRAALAGLLWPETPEAEARTSLRQAVYQLRQVTPDLLTATRDSVKLSKQHPVAVDALHFKDQATQGLKPSQETEARDALRTAAELYQGEFLAGFYVADAMPFEDWVLSWRELLHRLAFQSLQRLTASSIAKQRVYEGLHYAQRLLELEPWHENSHFQMMKLLALNGQKQAALLQYQKCCQLLEEELGVQPSAALTKLCEEIRSDLCTPSLPQAEGAHPLPGSGQLQPASDEPRPHNLRTSLSSFVGRSRYLADLQQMLSTPEARLVSLIGPGGVGKTRLANRLGLQLLPDFRDGVWLIDLLAVSDDAHIEQAVTNVLNIRDNADHSPLESLCLFLADKQMLLLFDNCEHLVDAAAALATTLLQAAPGLKIVATSREPLHVDGERCVSVLPLTLPRPRATYAIHQLTAFESVQLFIERATAHVHTFALGNGDAQAVARICQLLDGIPLAIELVAARIRIFTLQQIAERLEHTPGAHLRLAKQRLHNTHPRHQTLLNLVEWSYTLLHPDERLLLERLSVFTGSWSLDAAGVICSDEPLNHYFSPGQDALLSTTPGIESEEHPARHLAHDAIFKLLAALVDKSLVVAEPSGEVIRYRLLETIRHFALGQLAAAGDENRLRDRHLLYFVHWIEERQVPPPGVPRDEWRAQIAPDLDNIRAGLSWSLRCGEAALGLRLALASGEFWFSQGFHRESIHWLQSLLQLPSAIDAEAARLAALSSMEFTQWWILGDYGAAHPLQQEALSLARKLGDQVRIEKTLNNMGGVALRVGDYEKARTHLEQSLALADKSGNQLNRAWSFILLGEVMLAQSRQPKATAYFERASQLLRLLQIPSLLAYPVRRLGQIALQAEDVRTALAHFEESLQCNLAFGDVEGKAAGIAAYAGVLLHFAHTEQSIMLCAAAAKMLKSSQLRMSPYDTQLYGELVATLRTRTHASAFQKAWDVGAALSVAQAVDLIEQWREHRQGSDLDSLPLL